MAIISTWFILLTYLWLCLAFILLCILILTSFYLGFWTYAYERKTLPPKKWSWDKVDRPNPNKKVENSSVEINYYININYLTTYNYTLNYSTGYGNGRYLLYPEDPHLQDRMYLHYILDTHLHFWMWYEKWVSPLNLFTKQPSRYNGSEHKKYQESAIWTTKF